MLNPQVRLRAVKPSAQHAESKQQTHMQIDDRALQGANLPASVLAARKAALTLLAEACIRLFERADDTFFQYAENAGSNNEQNEYLEAMRTVRLQRRDIERSFQQGLDQGFAHLTHAESLAEPKAALSGSMDSLSLVANDDMEVSVALGGMINKAIGSCASRIYQLTARLDAALPTHPVTDNSNPLHPRQLCECFNRACQGVEFSIRSRLILFKVFDHCVISDYERVLEAANRVLLQAGILPDLPALPPVPKRRERQSDGAEAASSDAPPEEVPVTTPNATSDSAAQAADNDFFAQLQGLMAAVRSAPAMDNVPMVTDVVNGPVIAGPIGSSAPEAAVVSNSDLYRLLDYLQHQKAGRGAASQPGLERFDVRKAVADMLFGAEAKQGPQRLAETDTDVINLVSMLFDFIFDDDNLPEPVKAVLARLQIPYLKLAVKDHTFFNRAEHPARQLLNVMAQAGIGLVEQGDASRQDPVLTAIRSHAHQVLDAKPLTEALFQELLVSFESFMASEGRRAQMIEQRTRASEEGKARVELAERAARAAIEARLQRQTEVPAIVLRILRPSWVSVLKLMYLKYGADSKNWLGAERTIDQLLVSTVKPDNDAGRRRLQNFMPVLQRNLKQGLVAINCNPFEMNELLKGLEQLQTQLLKQSLRGSDELELDAASELVAAIALDQERLGGVAGGGADGGSVGSETDSERAPESEGAAPLPVVEALPDLDEADEHWRLVNNLKVGVWFELHDESGSKTRCKLAAHIKSADKLIFVNRTGVKIAEKTALELAHAVKSGAAIMLDDSQLFDRALQNVIGNLRRVRETAH